MSKPSFDQTVPGSRASASIVKGVFGTTRTLSGGSIALIVVTSPGALADITVRTSIDMDQYGYVLIKQLTREQISMVGGSIYILVPRPR